jgi:hypothetical protein
MLLLLFLLFQQFACGATRNMFDPAGRVYALPALPIPFSGLFDAAQPTLPQSNAPLNFK